MQINHKKFAVALAVATLSATAYADEDSLQLYGVLDAGVAHVEHALGFDPNHPVGVLPYANASAREGVTGMYNGGLSASRWGLRGRSDLGEGLHSLFTLESGINVPSGQLSNAAASMANNRPAGPNMSADSAVSGQLFSRQAWVGLANASGGQLSLGRHQSFFLEDIMEFDPMRASQIFSPIGFSGTYAGGGATEDSRVDNSVRYTQRLGDFKIGALYKFGEVAAARAAQSAYQFNLGYEGSNWSVVAGAQHFDDAFLAAASATPGALAVTAADTTAYMLAGKLTWSPVTLRAGFEHESYLRPSHPQDDAITSLFGYALSGAVSTTAYNKSKNLNVVWTGPTWDVNSALSVTAAYYQVLQSDYSGTDCATASAKCAGHARFASLLGDYHFSKRTDVYAGWMSSGVTGGQAYAFNYKSNHILGAGLRVFF